MKMYIKTKKKVKMMKNLALILALSTVAISLNATTKIESCASNFKGFYAGIQTGGNISQATNEENQQLSKVTQSTTKFAGGMFAGYGIDISQCYYVGAEIYGNVGENKIYLVNAPVYKATLSNNGNVGAKLRVGYTASPRAMLFVTAGLEYSEWKLNQNLNTGKVKRNLKAQTKKINFAASIGSDIYLNNHVFVRPEYTYVAPIALKATSEKNIKISQHRFTLGLGYKI